MAPVSGLNNKKDERRYDHVNSSMGSGSMYEYQAKMQYLRDRQHAQNLLERANFNIGNNRASEALRILGAMLNSNSVEIESNAASLAASVQSLGQNSNHHHLYSS